MRTLMPRLLVLLCLCCCGVTAHGQTNAAQPAATEGPLTNASVVKLVRAGFSEKTVITIIRARPVHFDLAPDRLIELKKRGVSEKVILAMLARDEGMLLADDATGDGFGNDPFFDEGDRARRSTGAGAPAGQGEPGGVDIFGSSGGVRGRSRTNGVNGGGSGETQTTGSATVRILRPPTEAGGAPPKLERTQTLTNESVVELVEAGFSEGTIIRGIENAPADFDLAPAKLAELRRHRVTDAVIAAMRAAMSDDPTAAQTNNPQP